MATMRWIFVAVLLVVGCSEEPEDMLEPEPMDMDAVVPIDADSKFTPELLDDAFGILGLEYTTDAPRGVVTISFLDEPLVGEDGGKLAGWTDYDLCTPHVEALGHHGTLAHELGHALGLPHVADPHNVMFETIWTEDLGPMTDEQTDQMQRSARYLATGCP